MNQKTTQDEGNAGQTVGRRGGAGRRTVAQSATVATIVVLVVAGLVASPVFAQTAVSADGIIESTVGGFRFPDGTVQTTAASSGSLAPVEDTGQNMCWDAAGDPAACAGTGQDGDYQAGVDWPAPRFLHNVDGTVTDALTGLVWLQDANCFGVRSWASALSDANGLAGGACSLTDGSLATYWRLPNAKELLSLIDLGESSPALPQGHPFSNVQSATPPDASLYWTSTSLVADPAVAWAVDLTIGSAAANSFITAKSSSYYVWPVRDAE